MKRSFDIAVIGSGFAGSLMAMVARRLGLSVVLLERGRHPRFAIGESSTPIANLLLEQLSNSYGLPRLRPLAKWGSWQREYPHIACGLKRGFTFYHHRAGQHVESRPDRSDQLLVAASPNDDIADTQWYRPDFDQFLVEEAQAIGVEYLDEANLSFASFQSGVATIEGTRHGEPLHITAQFLIDASGPNGFLCKQLGIDHIPIKDFPRTQSLYTHFRNVGDCQEIIHRGAGSPPPYPPDFAAVHHVFEGGWVWSLRFNNDITSAGLMATDSLAAQLNLAEGAPAWKRLLLRFPTLQSLFGEAQPTRPFTYAPSISFRAAEITGPNWLLLPSAAGFVDPLLSTGFPLTLLGIHRVAAMLKQDWRSNRWGAQLKAYRDQTTAELDATSRLVSALYKCATNFPQFTSLCLLYFAAASFSEAARRLGRPELASGFLLHDHPTFGPALRRCCDLVNGPGAIRAPLANEVRAAIEPIDVAGFGRSDRGNWYPVDPKDTLAAAHRLGVGTDEIHAMFKRCGVACASP